ncbi:DUF6153 family protein [Streptomyces sp. NPDC046862]|uniref:DUF6153 family protein n=1 Tax=Streptomyces sp. NPDC046862 TaxID=3154603 RepID=UPI0034547867
MRASRTVRAGGALRHLLLVVVLALGVLAMHSLGHPQESSASAMGSASHATSGSAGMAHETRSASTVPATDAGRHAAEPADSPATHGPTMAMDMLSLCLAVLFGAWVLAALLRSAFARHQEWLSELLTGVTVVLRPDPPPRQPDLTRLSVLRL